MNFVKLIVTLLIIMNKASGISALEGLDILEKSKLRNIKLNISPDKKNQDPYYIVFTIGRPKPVPSSPARPLIVVAL